MAELTAKFLDAARGAKNLDGTKERVLTLLGFGINDGRIVFFSEVRIWASRTKPLDSALHCSVWVHYAKTLRSGNGQASGTGYHRHSAAMDDALRDAGVELSEAIDGRGDDSMREALTAVGVALGLPRATILIVPT